VPFDASFPSRDLRASGDGVLSTHKYLTCVAMRVAVASRRPFIVVAHLCEVHLYEECLSPPVRLLRVVRADDACSMETEVDGRRGTRLSSHLLEARRNYLTVYYVGWTVFVRVQLPYYCCICMLLLSIGRGVAR